MIIENILKDVIIRCTYAFGNVYESPKSHFIRVNRAGLQKQTRRVLI